MIFEKICNDLNIGLPKEIELRTKQYEYYREQLLIYDVKYNDFNKELFWFKTTFNIYIYKYYLYKD